MNVAVRTDKVGSAAQPAADPLDHLADKLFHKMGTDGVYARTALYEDVVERLAALITRNREAGTEVMRFPPVMNRAQLEKSGYLKSFPNLLGCVCGLHGTEREINAAVSRFDAGGDWTTSLSPADLVLSPAACYPVYPIAAARGPLPQGGLRFDVAADCFRREPSRHLDRLQSFRMREYVCIGSPDDVSDFRDRWMVRAQAIARDLGLTFRVDYASDPVLRPRRPDEGGQPEAAIAEIRAAGPAALGGAADRVHELQLSPRPFRHDLGHQGCQRRAGAYRLRGIRNGSSGGRDVPYPRHGSREVARRRARIARACNCGPHGSRRAILPRSSPQGLTSS